MRRTAFWLALLLLLGWGSSPPASAGEGAADPAPPANLDGTLTVRDGIPVLRLWGEPRERGFAHGWLLARAIVSGADKSLSMFLRGREALYASMMLPLAKNAFRFSDDEMAEIEGILAGIEARLPDEADRTIDALGRPPELADLLLMNVFGDVYALGCSSVAVWGERTADGTPLVARNFDFPALDIVVAHQHVRIVAPREGAKGYVGISYPGGIGMLTALNEDGVFAAIHDVHVMPSIMDIAQKNVPRLVALRRLMEQLSAGGAVEKAMALCRGWNTLYGNNLMVATPEAGQGAPAGVLEYDTREKKDHGVDVREAQDGQPFVICTNHFRLRGEGTCWRYDDLAKSEGKDDETKVTVDTLFSWMGRVSFPEPDEKIVPGRLGTLHQVVAETGAKRLHVRVARVGENIRDAKTVTFDVAAEVAGFAEPPAVGAGKETTPAGS